MQSQSLSAEEVIRQQEERNRAFLKHEALKAKRAEERKQALSRHLKKQEARIQAREVARQKWIDGSEERERNSKMPWQKPESKEKDDLMRQKRLVKRQELESRLSQEQEELRAKLKQKQVPELDIETAIKAYRPDPQDLGQ